MQSVYDSFVSRLRWNQLYVKFVLGILLNIADYSCKIYKGCSLSEEEGIRVNLGIETKY